MVDLIERCANHGFGKSLEDLTRLMARISAGTSWTESPEVVIRDINRRLGRDTIARLVGDYQDGQHTTALMANYGLSKSSVLRLLRDNGVKMRRQGVSPTQAAAARELYEQDSMSLAAVARELNLPKQSVRLALLALGVAMRPTGGSRGRGHAARRAEAAIAQFPSHLK